MSQWRFDFNQCSAEDCVTALRYIGALDRPADFVIAPDGTPYIYRWYVVRDKAASVYFHIQVGDDPERPLHDHPWENQSVILAGGYRELLQPEPPHGPITEHRRAKGDVIVRTATCAHRLLIPEGVAYTMTQFSLGPVVREWGFWYPDNWRPFTAVTRNYPTDVASM